MAAAMGSGLLWQALIWGMLAALLSVRLEPKFVRLQEAVFSRFWQLLAHSPPREATPQVLWRSFAAVALWEELVKYLLLAGLRRALIALGAATCQPRLCRGMLYLLALALALAFAGTENLWYAVHSGWASLAWRLVSSTVLHLSLAIVLARAFMPSALRGSRTGTASSNGLLPAVLWHGSYNSALALGAGWLAAGLLLLLLGYLALLLLSELSKGDL